MGRKRDTDLLLSCKFHLYDISPNLTSLSPFVLKPSLGFSSISAPAPALDMITITPGNAYYPHQVVKRATPNVLEAARGVVLNDKNFWDWYVATLTGDPGSLQSIRGGRRNLLLVHFSMVTEGAGNDLLTRINKQTRFNNYAVPVGAITDFANADAFVVLGAVPARAWVLYDCLPAGYRAASDFEASTISVSIQSLSLSYSEIDEMNLSF